VVEHVTRSPRCPGTGGATLTTRTSPPPSSTSSLSLPLAGITGTMEPRGIFISMAVPADRSWPLHWPTGRQPRSLAARRCQALQSGAGGAVPDYCFTVDGRRMLYDVKLT
jgi:hypothetical protein